MKVRFLVPVLVFWMSFEAFSSEVKLGSPEALWKTIPIVAWYGIPTQFATPERYREMAEAGFTMCLPLDGSTEAARRHLDCAASAGIKLILMEQRMLEDPASVAKEFREHPALGMYFLRDEPGAASFPRLREVREILAQADPEHISYMNLYPNYADSTQMEAPDYSSYVERFLSEVRPAYLGYDHYGLIQERGRTVLRPGYYQNLELISKKARECGVPFWAFVLATPHGPYGAPTEGGLRLQAFSNLAYGARGIQYFTYWTPLSPDREFVFHDGPILQDGTRTQLLDVITKVNRDIRTLTPALVGLKAAGVQHFKPVDPGVEVFSPGHGMASLRGESAVLGFFTDEAGEGWVLVVNRDFEKPSELTVTTLEGIDGVGEFSKVSGKAETVNTVAEGAGKVFSIRLEPGDGRLFHFAKSNASVKE